MILENKQNISKLFFDNWTTTAIQWYGIEFDIGTKDEWIAVSYTPTTVSNAFVNTKNDYSTGVIDVDIYARKENRTYQLYDMILEMLSATKIGNNSIRGIDIDGKDLISTDNGDYRVLNISINIRTF